MTSSFPRDGSTSGHPGIAAPAPTWQASRARLLRPGAAVLAVLLAGGWAPQPLDEEGRARQEAATSAEERATPRDVPKLKLRATSGEARLISTDREPMRALAVFPDGKRVVGGSRDGSVTIWDLETGRMEKDLTGPRFSASEEVPAMSRPDSGIMAVAVSPDGRQVIAGNGDDEAMVYNVESGRAIRKFELDSPADAVALTPDGNFAITGSGRLRDVTSPVTVWDVKTGEKVRTLLGGQGWVSCLAVSPDGRFVVSGEAKTGDLRVWELASGRLLHTLSGHDGDVRDVMVTADGETIVSGQAFGKGALNVWNLSDGRLKKRIPGYDSRGHSLDITPDGRFCVALGGRVRPVLRVWDLQSGQLIRTLPGGLSSQTTREKRSGTTPSASVRGSRRRQGCGPKWPRWRNGKPNRAGRRRTGRPNVSGGPRRGPNEIGNGRPSGKPNMSGK